MQRSGSKVIFTKEEVRIKITEILKSVVDLKFEEVNFLPEYGCAEESFYLVSGKKSDFSELIEFWIKGYERIIEFENRYEGELDCLEWYEEEGIEIDKITFLKSIVPIINRTEKGVAVISSPIKFYQIISEWNEQVFIVENKENYMMIYWDTTA